MNDRQTGKAQMGDTDQTALAFGVRTCLPTQPVRWPCSLMGYSMLCLENSKSPQDGLSG